MTITLREMMEAIWESTIRAFNPIKRCKWTEDKIDYMYRYSKEIEKDKE